MSDWATIQRRRMDRFGTRVQDAFLPSKESVTSDYWDYTRYRFFQRIASSCITVFSTQQMLQAVGLGATRRLPAAAAVNWVLKDGLGRLGKLSVATNFGQGRPIAPSFSQFSSHSLILSFGALD